MQVHYGYTVTLRETGEVISFPVQGEALPCPQVGANFEVTGRFYGKVVDATTIIEEHPQGDSGGTAWRRIVHAIVIEAARALDRHGPELPQDYLRTVFAGRSYTHQWTVQLWAYLPDAPQASLIAGRVNEWSSLRNDPLIHVESGSDQVPTPGAFGYVGMAFQGQARHAYIFEVITRPLDNFMHFYLLGEQDQVLHNSRVRNDASGHWIVTSPELTADTLCRFTAAADATEMWVESVILHAFLLN